MGSQQRLPRMSLSGYFKGLAARMKIQVDQMTPVIAHSGEMGDNDHAWFADLLRAYLPDRIGIATGFVVNSRSDSASADFFAAGGSPRMQDRSIGPQTDILLLDVLHNAPFCRERTFTVCPVEMVLAAIEVTRNLTAGKAGEDVKKLQRVRELAAEKVYREGSAEVRRPRAYLVGLGSSTKAETVRQAICGPGNDDLRPNGYLLLDKNECGFRIPYQDDFLVAEEDALFHFIATLRHQVEDMNVGPADLSKYLASSQWRLLASNAEHTKSAPQPTSPAETERDMGACEHFPVAGEIATPGQINRGTGGTGPPC